MSETDTPARRSQQEQEKLEKQFRELMEHQVTFNEHLGFKIEQLGAQRCSIRFTMKPELVGHFLYGRLHGGVTSSVLDAAAGVAILWGLSEKYPHESADDVMKRFVFLGTIDLRIDYLKSGTGKSFVAYSNVVRLGRRIATTRMELYNDTDDLIATGTGTYIVS